MQCVYQGRPRVETLRLTHHHICDVVYDAFNDEGEVLQHFLISIKHFCEITSSNTYCLGQHGEYLSVWLQINSRSVWSDW